MGAFFLMEPEPMRRRRVAKAEAERQRKAPRTIEPPAPIRIAVEADKPLRDPVERERRWEARWAAQAAEAVRAAPATDREAARLSARLDPPRLPVVLSAQAIDHSARGRPRG
jgi:hypothetical protein